jgi:hypothetical protein
MLSFYAERAMRRGATMTDLQILTIAVPVVLSILLPLSMLIYSNSRIPEVRETLRAEMALGFERLGNKTDHLAGEVATLKEMFAAHLREHNGVK